jgi:hypothetical protein
MAAAEYPKGVDRDVLHQTIDELPDDALAELARFIKFLQFKRRRDGQTDVDAQTHYSQSIQSRQLREQLARDYDELTTMYGELADETRRPLEGDDNFSWLEQVPSELQTEFLMDLLSATRRSRQSHDWSEVIRIIERWKAIAEGRPPFEPVNFPEGILEGYDFSPEFIAEARKELWAGFGKEPV